MRAAWAALTRAAGSDAARKVVYAVQNRALFADLAQHDRMLADRQRVETYYAALAKHLEPGDVVVDLGTGSGVLSLFAARLGAGRVHAIEHGPIIEAAIAVARDNGIENIEFHRLHSGSFELPERADVIVHEQIGESLFDERVVENVCDLRDRVLKPGGKILPAHLRLYVEPVEIEEDLRHPHAWTQELHGVSFRALEQYADEQSYLYEQPVLRPFPLRRFLAEPAPVVSVDLHVADGELPHEVRYERPVTEDGILDGMCVYFEAAFDDELAFGSSPDRPPTSWGSPLLRVDSRPVRMGEVIRLRLEARDLAIPRTWRWSVDVVPGSSR